MANLRENSRIPTTVFTETQNEEWRAVVGYEGLYEVSNLGNVKRLQRRIRNGFSTRVIEERNLRIQKLGNGYSVVALTKNYKSKTTLVHRIVANAFLDNKDNLPVVNHKDSVRHNNNVSNLEWCTVSHNIKHGFQFGNKVPNRPMLGRSGALHNRSKKVRVFDLNDTLLFEFGSACEAARNMPFSQSFISCVCRGETTHDEFKFIYA
jgi:hypothetical protein